MNNIDNLEKLKWAWIELGILISLKSDNPETEIPHHMYSLLKQIEDVAKTHNAENHNECHAYLLVYLEQEYKKRPPADNPYVEVEEVKEVIERMLDRSVTAQERRKLFEAIGTDELEGRSYSDIAWERLYSLMKKSNLRVKGKSSSKINKNKRQGKIERVGGPSFYPRFNAEGILLIKTMFGVKESDARNFFKKAFPSNIFFRN